MWPNEWDYDMWQKILYLLEMIYKIKKAYNSVVKSDLDRRIRFTTLQVKTDSIVIGLVC